MNIDVFIAHRAACSGLWVTKTPFVIFSISKQIFFIFIMFMILQKYFLNYIHIWQVSPQPSCSDTC